MNMKRICILMLCLCFCAQTAYALPLTTPDLPCSYVRLQRPSGTREPTFEPLYTIAGFGLPDSVITVYRSDGSQYVNVLDENGEPLTATIGASGLFMLQLSLEYDYNHLLLHITREGNSEGYVKLTLQLLSPTITESIRNFKIDVKDVKITN